MLLLLVQHSSSFLSTPDIDECHKLLWIMSIAGELPRSHSVKEVGISLFWR